MRNSLSGNLSLSSGGNGFYDVVTRFALAIDNDTGAKVSETEKTKLRKLVSDLRAAGIWNKIICLYPFVGNSDAHAYNLINPATYKLTFYGSPTHDANGVHFNNGQYALSSYNVPYNNMESFQFMYERTPLAAHTHTGFTYGFRNMSEASYSVARNQSGANYWARCGGAYSGVLQFSRTASVIGHTLINRPLPTSFRVLWENQVLTSIQDVYQNGTNAPLNLFYAFDSNNAGYGTLITDLSFSCYGHGKGNSLSPTEEQSLITIVKNFQIALNRA